MGVSPTFLGVTPTFLERPPLKNKPNVSNNLTSASTLNDNDSDDDIEGQSNLNDEDAEGYSGSDTDYGDDLDDLQSLGESELDDLADYSDIENLYENLDFDPDQELDNMDDSLCNDNDGDGDNEFEELSDRELNANFDGNNPYGYDCDSPNLDNINLDMCVSNDYDHANGQYDHENHVYYDEIVENDNIERFDDHYQGHYFFENDQYHGQYSPSHRNKYSSRMSHYYSNNYCDSTNLDGQFIDQLDNVF